MSSAQYLNINKINFRGTGHLLYSVLSSCPSLIPARGALLHVIDSLSYPFLFDSTSELSKIKAKKTQLQITH